MLKIGDTVRFLNEIGGGKVVKIDATTKMVFVEDENGFEIPMLPHECVVINNVKDNNFPAIETTTSAPKSEIIVPSVKNKQTLVYETPEGDELNVLLAFVPLDIKQLQTTACDCILINDSNYFLYYNIVAINNGYYRSISNGLIEPNMQDVFYKLEKNELNEWEHLRVQLIPFKQNKTYQPQHVLDLDIKLNVVNFYKLHAFADNDYFDEPAMLINLQNERQTQQFKAISGAQIREAMLQKETHKKDAPHKKTYSNDVLEIDLHIAQLLDNTAGMNNADMLNYQMEVFHKTMKENLKQRGKRIVFIHGKGEGVLRKEIEKALKHNYKQCRFQDASFREYGFGATMVII